MISEIAREREIPYDFTDIWNLNNKNKKIKQKQTHKYRELVVATAEAVGGFGKIGEDD